MLARDVVAVRDRLRADGRLAADGRFAVGLRLSARAARELLEQPDGTARFRDWLDGQGMYVFTINGFPFGDFHGRRVKERVFAPDWTTAERADYTRDLFRILAAVGTVEAGGSVSSVPGSHKSFAADERVMRRQLLEMADFIEALSSECGMDLHLGLEPEPFGHFENTAETAGFFARLSGDAEDAALVARRIGVNFDSCHFALQFEEAGVALDALVAAGVRISKIHLSSALAFDPRDAAAVAAVRAFDEPVYFHQTLVRRDDGTLRRFPDLPEFLAAAGEPAALDRAAEARVHFHIPLDAEPAWPLGSTRRHALDTLKWRMAHPGACRHFEIETYTWAVLPPEMRRPVDQQIASEFAWVLAAT